MEDAGSHLCKLPEEVLLFTLQFLTEKELFMVALVNKQFYRLSEDDTLWNAFYQR